MNHTPRDGHHEGRLRKDAALSLHEKHRQQFILAGQRLLLRLLLNSGTPVSIDAVRERLPLPAGVAPRACGAIPKALMAAKILESAGFVHSTRPEAHARPVTAWRLHDRAAAERWLMEHPLPEELRPPHDGQQLLLGI